MSLKIAAAAESSPKSRIGASALENLVVVRKYDEERDRVSVEEMEKMCEVGQRGKPSLVTDLLGDPICRIRHFPSHIMLVAEYGEGGIVGVIRGCIKTVTRGVPSVYVRLAYILGLRVSPTHRRLGIGAKLVQEMEKWCKKNGAEYAYIATDCTNQPSINLFTQKCSYIKLRSPTILVQPVHAHYKPIPSSISILRIHPQMVESIYQKIFTNSEFFPKDIDKILYSKLNLGTFMAVPKSQKCPSLNALPSSYAMLSVWNTKEVFKFQVKGVSPLTYAWCVGSRLLDELMPWLGLPSIPDVFRQFGVYFLYGLHMEGKCGSRLMKALCNLAHNMARDDDGCGAVVAEVGQRDPVREAIPHWSRFSWAEDMWCMKKLKDADHQDVNGRCEPSDWTKSRSSSPVIFVDPREF
ncbi:probable N-acetyltransferase HLS1 [Tripterygium wilfordii]|uniref:probable N-acetyltransferase HLS1 n=1 Tax=Tripterygium wilfordii TaxID=458696 RepID=UPI0018F85737|nr:probable N-acetyltransferase HLS1 [Tripterygium wilfordii]